MSERPQHAPDCSYILRCGFAPCDCEPSRSTLSEEAPADPIIADMNAQFLEAVEIAKAWRNLVFDIARELGCLASTFPDGNGHVLAKAKKLAQLAQCVSGNEGSDTPADIVEDAMLFRALDAERVQSIYFADGSQLNPGSLSLRAALLAMARKQPTPAPLEQRP